MIFFLPDIFRPRSAFRLAALAVAILAVVSLHASAQGTHLWTQSRLEEFEKGTPQGAALTSDGHLRTGPSLTELATTPSTYVWSVAMDKAGTAYVGTASPATVLRIAPDGKPFTLFESKDIAVQVVRLGPDGALYAATLPSGKVYGSSPTPPPSRMKPAPRWSSTPQKSTTQQPAQTDGRQDQRPTKTPENPQQIHYIWEMTFDTAGRLYIATGGPGVIYRVDPAKSSAKPEAFFKSDEQHIRSLAWDAREI